MRKRIMSIDQDYSSLDAGFEEVRLKSHVWMHFKRNKYGICRCNHCGYLCKQLNQSTNLLFYHLSRAHSQLIYGFGAARKQQQQFLIDFTETLVLQGYPMDKIIQNILNLLTNNQACFHQIAAKLLDDFSRARESLPQKLQKLPIQTDKDQVEGMMIGQYPDLSNNARSHLIQQYFWLHSSQQQIILNFKEKGYNIISLNQQQNISIILIVTESMRNSYIKYGDCVNIDLIDKVYKKKSPYGFSQYSCWFFTGQDQNLQNVLFGFAIIDQISQKNLQFLLASFFKQMNQIMPLSICIPPYILLQQEIKRINSSINIIVNWYHKLKFIKQILQKQIERQSIIRSLCQCLKTTSKQQFDFIMNRIMSKVSDQDAIKYAVASIKYYPSLLASASKTLNIYHCRDKQEKLSKTAHICHQIRQKAQLLEQMLKIYEKISQKLEERLKICIQELGEYKFQVINPVTVKISSRKNYYCRWKIYTVKFHVQYNHWICNCKYLQHTGVPCAHLIKVIQKFDGNLLYYTNSRWLVPL